MNATIGSDSLVQFKAQSNSFYVNSGTSGSTTTTATRSSAGTVITSAGQAISIKGGNYPNNRLHKSILTFAITNPQFVV